ncbi:MAG: methylmalonyl-CoA carboxyltransferase, partial [Clostridia bacterium]|nr:methylmalonyl-CoA carboxyltransferase [Clostridia bacterium]
MSSSQTLEQVMAKKKAILQGDAARVEKQRQAGKLTARERVTKLLDQGSFVELDTLVACGEDGAGVVTGYGTVQDRPVYVFSQDYAVHGGAMGQMQAQKILKVLDLAQKTGAPVVAMLDSAGVRLDEGALAMSAYAQVYTKMARLSGVCPMIAMVLGPCVGAASLIAQLCDVSVMAQSVSEMMLAGPQVMSAATGTEYTGKTLGGADVMAKQGMASLVCDTEDEAMGAVATLLDLLPGCNAEDAPIVDSDDMNRLMNAAKGCTSCELMAALADNGAYVELNKEFGRSLRTVLARLGGRSVGIVCSRPNEDEGRLDAAACQKAARFVRLCDCYSLPVVSLVDTKGLALV